MKTPIAIHWFRRDLRLQDNAALYHALRSGLPVLPVFIFDTDILEELEDRSDKRVSFIYTQLQSLHAQLGRLGSSLHVLHGKPLDCFRRLSGEYAIQAVYTTHDYEPYARQRDDAVARLLSGQGTGFFSYKDQVIFEKDEVLKDNGAPYTVYTPYSKKWKTLANDFYLRSYPAEKYFQHLLQCTPFPFPTLSSLGFQEATLNIPPAILDEDLAARYDTTRDIPSVNGTTRLSVHLRFGTISIRALARDAARLNEKLLNELIWRDFYQAILWHFPHVVSHSFKKEYDNIQWRNNEEEFDKWCNGQTGYPIVDAGMRELNETGYMHNRVRMITAGFLTKHLLIDWRWGEAYFAKKLLDFDLASNNGGWQWAAGSGCDAAPYFRIFNPYLQTKKFDPQLKYIRNWVPELEEFSYPKPIVEHEVARKRCLEAYAQALKNEMKPAR